MKYIRNVMNRVPSFVLPNTAHKHPPPARNTPDTHSGVPSKWCELEKIPCFGVPQSQSRIDAIAYIAAAVLLYILYILFFFSSFLYIVFPLTCSQANIMTQFCPK